MALQRQCSEVGLRDPFLKVVQFLSHCGAYSIVWGRSMGSRKETTNDGENS